MASLKPTAAVSAPVHPEDAAVNILVNTFPGLGLPPTLCIVASRGDGIRDVLQRIMLAMPGDLEAREGACYGVTVGRKSLRLTMPPEDDFPLSSMAAPGDPFVTFHLTCRLLGGKGGFGSQLRAAGGRMSSKRKRNQEYNNGSSRNLDGRRIRTINEAKALAEYLSIKPDMERREKENRKARLLQVVKLSDQRQRELQTGRGVKIDGKWVEDREETVEKTRTAVQAAIDSGNFRDIDLTTSGRGIATPACCSSSSDHDSEGAHGKGAVSDDSAEQSQSSHTSRSAGSSPQRAAPDALSTRCFFGFEEDDEFMSSSEDEP